MDNWSGIIFTNIVLMETSLGSTNENLRFLQINLHHSKNASNVFDQTQRSESIHIGLITEPYYFKGKVRNMSEW